MCSKLSDWRKVELIPFWLLKSVSNLSSCLCRGVRTSQVQFSTIYLNFKTCSTSAVASGEEITRISASADKP